MPDLERSLRELELQLARHDPYHSAYLRGLHAGRSAARREIALIVGAVGLATFALLAAAGG